MRASTLYIILILTVFGTLAAVFLFLPRSIYSELEKRELADFPEFSFDKLKDASYAGSLAHWFSDTEPYRDFFMTMSMSVRDRMRYSFGDHEETISFHATDNNSGSKEAPGEEGNEIPGYENHVNVDDNAKIASSGIVIVGKAPKARALNAFGGEPGGGRQFAATVSEYARTFPGVKVYAMVIPLSSEFYTPEKARNTTKPQLPFIQNIYNNLTDGAHGVNAYTPLANHVEEDIYLRTDHHWAPLGAYYAAKAFAEKAGVTFRDLSAYDRKTVKNFVGSMYGYSKDIAIKNSPEDFVYYVPNGVNPTTTYYDYKVNKDYQVTSEGPGVKGNFFYHFKDGSGGAYCTFMGSDQRLTHVKTGTKNGRRLIIIKDSYGNPVPGFLFYSFEDIYVVDFRYFTRNMKKFVNDNRVTDILFTLNVFNAYSSTAAGKMKHFLTQTDGSFAAPTPAPTIPDAPSSKASPHTPEKSVTPAPSPDAPTESSELSPDVCI